MIRRIANLSRRRRGTVAVLACILMIALLGMVAFAVDLGYLATSQAELQRSADASALAACYQLIYQGKPGTPVDLSGQVPNVPVVARQYAGYNHVCNSAPGVAGSDIVVGYMADPTQSGGTINTAADINSFNAVQVTVRRSSDDNGLVPSFFGKIFGVNGTNASASATAAFISQVGGLGIPLSSTGPENLMLLPFAFDIQTWNSVLAGDTSVSTDNYNCLSVPDVVSSGADGVREFNLFPTGTGLPGNRGTVNIGVSDNSTSIVVNQILNGISPAQMATYPNSEITFDSTGHVAMNGNTGISAGFKGALTAIVGQKRLIPLFDSCANPGNNAVFQVCAFVPVEICYCNLSGAMSSKCLIVQPCTMFTGGAVPSTSSGTTTSYYVYSPIHLVK
jgi:Flp pilus assembly protein TadG